MNTKHTPGPWQWYVAMSGGFTVRDAGNGNICSLLPYGNSQANAQLVTAAPELLAYLKNLYTKIHAFTMDAELMPKDLGVLFGWMEEIKHKTETL